MEPFKLLKKQKTIDFNLCIICQKNDGKTLKQAQAAGIEKLKKVSKQRKDLFDAVYAETIERMEGVFSTHVDFDLKICYHKNPCYSVYTNILW